MQIQFSIMVVGYVYFISLQNSIGPLIIHYKLLRKHRHPRNRRVLVTVQTLSSVVGLEGVIFL